MKLRYKVAVGALVVVAGYVFYDKVISQEAKDSVKNMAQGVKESYLKIHEVLESMEGEVVDDPNVLPNVQSTKMQWESLGY